MPASPPTQAVRLHAAATLALAVAVGAVSSAAAQAERTPAETIEAVRALERAGHFDEAESLLREAIVNGQGGARDAPLLLELARLSPLPEESIDLARQVIAKTRDGQLAARARTLIGDYLYAQGRYLAAASEYQAAEGLVSGDESDDIALKRAASLLAAGDTSAAEEAYRALAGGGAAPRAATPWAMLGLGRALAARGRPHEAAAILAGLVEAYPDHDAVPLALAEEAEALLAAGEPDSARAVLGELEERFPRSFEAVLARHAVDSAAPSGEPEGPPEEAAPEE